MMQHELSARLRAAGPPPSFDHLCNPDLLRRLTITDVVIDDSGDDAEPVKRTRQRKPTVVSAIRQMKRAGLDIAGCEFNPRAGTFKVIAGKPVDAATPDNPDSNEWDGVLQ
jgi:hypothetical protein